MPPGNANCHLPGRQVVGEHVLGLGVAVDGADDGTERHTPPTATGLASGSPSGSRASALTKGMGQAEPMSK